MRVRKRLDQPTWERIVIGLALAAIAAWTLGWVAGTIVTIIVAD